MEERKHHMLFQGMDPLSVNQMEHSQRSERWPDSVITTAPLRSFGQTTSAVAIARPPEMQSPPTPTPPPYEDFLAPMTSYVTFRFASMVPDFLPHIMAQSGPYHSTMPLALQVPTVDDISPSTPSSRVGNNNNRNIVHPMHNLGRQPEGQVINNPIARQIQMPNQTSTQQQQQQQEPKLGMDSTYINCPTCKEWGMTVIKTEPNQRTHATAMWLCSFGWCCCSCLFPYFIKRCKTAKHYCSKCRTYLGVHYPTLC